MAESDFPVPTGDTVRTLAFLSDLMGFLANTKKVGKQTKGLLDAAKQYEDVRTGAAAAVADARNQARGIIQDAEDQAQTNAQKVADAVAQKMGALETEAETLAAEKAKFGHDMGNRISSMDARDAALILAEKNLAERTGTLDQREASLNEKAGRLGSRENDLKEQKAAMKQLVSG